MNVNQKNTPEGVFLFDVRKVTTRNGCLQFVYVPRQARPYKRTIDGPRFASTYRPSVVLSAVKARQFLPRKEVIQPQVPLRLPCYDFTPVINPTFGAYPLAVGDSDFWLSQLPWCDGRCVQGPGTYSPWRSDPRLLAIPPSWGRIAAPNPN